MRHPIVSELKVFRLYILAWLLFTAFHVFVDWLTFDIDAKTMLLDAVVFNSLMFFFGLSVWYPVLYVDNEKGLINTVTQFLAAGIVIVVVWLLIGILFLKLLLSPDKFALMFDDQSYIIRVVVGIFQFLLFVLVYYMFKFFNELDEKNRAQDHLNALLRETEFKALKSQMNPHFLFNSLNSISALTIINPDDAREMINKLSEFLRYSLKKNVETTLPLKEELSNVDRYMEIEKVRFGDRLKYTTHTDSQCLDMLLPVMLLQPIYENAVKYGVYESIEPVKVITYCECFDGFLKIRVINNFDEEALRSKKGEGVGLNNIRDRLYLIYGRTDLLSIIKEKGCFEVVIMIPQS
nr:histidine kinase [uncultured Carboxylicivirga sp.]